MSKRKKNNIIIGSLLAVVLLMAVGYAAFSTVLNIKGTGSISSKWNIKITNVEVSNTVGDASDGEGTTFEDLTATINSNLVSPGDSITYDVTVRNDGSLDAVLTNINLSESTNPAISFSTSNLEAGAELQTGEEAILKVTITYNDVTEQPENTSANLNVTLTYEQKGSSSVVPGGDNTTIGGQEVEIVTSGDGLYADEYEPGRYIYKGTNPNNYITFSGETWRIISVESDGSIKIMRNESIGNRAFDSEGLRDSTSNGAGGTYCANGSLGCNAWAISDNFSNGTYTGTVLKDAELNTYLNEEYLPTLSDSDKVISHTWNIGVVTDDNNDLAAQINDEKGTSWNGKVGLITVSEYIRANTNTEQCGTHSLNKDNYSICKTTDWMYNSVPTNGYMWTISPSASSSYSVFYVDSRGRVRYGGARSSSHGVVPVLYLSSDITLSGTGESGDPFVIS